MQPNRIVSCCDCHKDFPTTATVVKYCPKCRSKHYAKAHPKQTYYCQYSKCGKSFPSAMPWAGYCCPSHRVLAFKERTFAEAEKCQTNP
jgi:hypothetical protein